VFEIGHIRIGAAVAWTLRAVRVALKRDKWPGRKLSATLGTFFAAYR